MEFHGNDFIKLNTAEYPHQYYRYHLKSQAGIFDIAIQT